jgi:uncharacterized membrane protein
MDRVLVRASFIWGVSPEMATQKKSIVIDAPPEAVAAYIDNPINMPEWLPSLIEVRDVSGGGVGQQFAWTYQMGGLRFEGESTVTEYVNCVRSVHESKGGIASTWTTTLEPRANGTELTIQIEYAIPVPVLGRLAEKLVVKRDARELEEALKNVKETVES